MPRYKREQSVEVRTLKTDGRTVALMVNDRGIFHAEIGDERIEAKSLDSLVDKVKKHIKRLGQIAIPVTLMKTGYDDDEPSFRNAFIVGTGGRRHEPLYQEEGDAGRVDSAGYNETPLRRLTRAERNFLISLWREHRRAYKRFEELTEEYGVNGGELLAAEARRIDGTPEPEGDDDAV